MRISPVIEQMRRFCPRFVNRVAGGLDWDPTTASALPSVPAAFVITIGDAADESNAQNLITQMVRDEIDVCVVMANKDERGQAVADLLHDVRAELFRALVGFAPGPEAQPLQYGGGALLAMDRGRVVYRFRFFSDFQLGRYELSDGQQPETWQELELFGLPELEGIDTRYDFIDPLRDPNAAPGGPDGRVEFENREDLNP